MKVTILSPDLSTNCLGRALVLAEILALDHLVKILGPELGDGIWPPAGALPENIVAVPGGRWPGFARSVRALIREIEGEAIIAVKPRFTSLGVALAARRSMGLPVVLDMDDDETALKPVPLRPDLFAGDFLAPDGGLSRLVIRRAIPHADGLTVASSQLQNRVGGELVPHAKNTDSLRPIAGRREAWRARLGLRSETLVLFLGTPRPWKGVEDAALAVQSLQVPATLLVVGADDTDYARWLGTLLRVKTHPMVPFGSLPGYLEAADMVVIPQREETITRTQMPSKLFDAMAMAKPIVSTAVSDIPRILGEGRGIVVPPGNVPLMASAMARVIQDPGKAEGMGLKARAWCVEHASLQAARAPLNRALIRARERGNP